MNVVEYAARLLDARVRCAALAALPSRRGSPPRERALPASGPAPRARSRRRARARRRALGRRSVRPAQRADARRARAARDRARRRPERPLAGAARARCGSAAPRSSAAAHAVAARAAAAAGRARRPPRRPGAAARAVSAEPPRGRAPLPPPRAAAPPADEPDSLDELLAAADRAIGVRLGPRGRDKGAWGVRAARAARRRRARRRRARLARRRRDQDRAGRARARSGLWRVVEDPAIAMVGERARSRSCSARCGSRAPTSTTATRRSSSWYLLEWDAAVARLARRYLHERPKGPRGTDQRGVYLHKRFFADARPARDAERTGAMIVDELRIVGSTQTNVVMARRADPRRAARARHAGRPSRARRASASSSIRSIRDLAWAASTYLRTPTRVLWDVYRSRATRLEPLYDELVADIAATRARCGATATASRSRRAASTTFAAGERQIVGTVKNALIDGAARRGMRAARRSRAAGDALGRAPRRSRRARRVDRSRRRLAVAARLAARGRRGAAARAPRGRAARCSPVRSAHATRSSIRCAARARSRSRRCTSRARRRATRRRSRALGLGREPARAAVSRRRAARRRLRHRSRACSPPRATTRAPPASPTRSRGSAATSRALDAARRSRRSRASAAASRRPAACCSRTRRTASASTDARARRLYAAIAETCRRFAGWRAGVPRRQPAVRARVRARARPRRGSRSRSRTRTCARTSTCTSSRSARYSCARGPRGDQLEVVDDPRVVVAPHVRDHHHRPARQLRREVDRVVARARPSSTSPTRSSGWPDTGQSSSQRVPAGDVERALPCAPSPWIGDRCTRPSRPFAAQLRRHRGVAVERDVRDPDEVVAARPERLRDDHHDVALDGEMRAGDRAVTAGDA